ncbi:MAG: nucleotidyltransferase domain-containing protein [Candidatus Brennerbacteria bacterium]|nr:nucleotidyltransferase domain-containing protein [Candidatus Brennerbacteria bacterium]
MIKIDIKRIKLIFDIFSKIKLVYFFGSSANETAGPISDYDFAVYFDLRPDLEKDREKMFEIKFNLMDQLSRVLNTDKIDVVILNLTESPEFKYEIIKNGKLIYEKEPFQVLVEPKILNEYFDFHYFLKKYNLTKI